MSDLTNFLISFGFNLIVTLILVRWIYYPSTHDKRYVFTFIAFNTVIFFVLAFMPSIELGVGAGFGLFAIFSILRYRTDPLPIREMTYLFIIAALPVMNAAATNSSIWPELIAANLFVLVILFILEKGWGFRFESSRKIVYEKIELIVPEKHAELKADLETRTGLKINRFSIGKINFLRDIVDITIYYHGQTEDNWFNTAPAANNADDDSD